MAEYIAEDKKLPNGKNLAMPMIDVTSNQEYVPEKKQLPNGKNLAMPVIVVGGSSGPGGEGVASIDYKRGDNSANYPNVDSLYIITTMEDGTITTTEIQNVFTDVDYKLSIDPEKTRWDSENQNLILFNTDNTNITIPMDDLVNFDYFSTEIAKLPDKNYVQNLSPTFVASSVSMKMRNLSPTENLFSVSTIVNRVNKSGDVYIPQTAVDTTPIVPNFRHVMRRHNYNVGNIPSNNAVGVNILAFAPTVVLADNLVPETYVGGATPNANRLWTILPTSGLVNWTLELNITASITASNDADDLLRIELWNGTTRTKSRSILRSQLNDIVDPNDPTQILSSGGVDIPFYTNGANDPMCIASGGFKVLLFNRTGVAINNLVVDFRVKR